MSRELKVYREVNRREAAKAAGVHPRTPLLLRGQLTILGGEAALRNLPQDISNLESAQDSDTGEFFFVAGSSAVGGDDPIGPAP